jgi:hypothetical protein
MEHQKGRVMVGELADAIRSYAAREPCSRENLVKRLRALVAFYPSHIWKEDYLLFPLAGKVLTSQDQQDLIDRFAMVERELGSDAHEGFEKLAAELEQKVHGVYPIAFVLRLALFVAQYLSIPLFSTRSARCAHNSPDPRCGPGSRP